jgi:predicted RNase H-like HicB family nuclease
MNQAKYEVLEDDGSFFSSIPRLKGVWANAPTLEACRQELAEVLEDWLLLSLDRKLPIPPIAGIELKVREVA